jgi:hypothetical protein
VGNPIINPNTNGTSHKLCPRCGGDGVIPSRESLRLLRKRARKTLTQTAEAMGISTGYLCDLELGRRDWSTELEDKFKKAIAA